MKKNTIYLLLVIGIISSCRSNKANDIIRSLSSADFFIEKSSPYLFKVYSDPTDNLKLELRAINNSKYTIQRILICANVYDETGKLVMSGHSFVVTDLSPEQSQNFFYTI